jgi:cell division septation protein DedD
MPESEQPTKDVEIVLGPRQIASVLFVAAVFLGICTTIAYVVGRSATVTQQKDVVHAAANAAKKEQPESPIVVQAPAAVPAPKNPSSVAAEPETGNYLQLGAVPLGVAEVFAEGLAKKGYHAAITPSTSDGIARVLVGPFDQQQEQAAAQAELEKLGFRCFARRYSREKAQSEPAQ